jgi:hypothetical protein
MDTSTNNLRHYYLLAKGWYQAPSAIDGLRIITARVMDKENPSIEEAFGRVLPLVWKTLLATPITAADEKAQNPGSSPVQEFAEMWMFLRALAFNLEANPEIVYAKWDEAYAQMFLTTLAGRRFEEGELGKPDSTLMPINEPRKPYVRSNN